MRTAPPVAYLKHKAITQFDYQEKDLTEAIVGQVLIISMPVLDEWLHHIHMSASGTSDEMKYQRAKSISIALSMITNLQIVQLPAYLLPLSQH
jgi:hypothetical protein